MRYKIKEIPDEGLVVDQAIPPEILKDALEGLEPDLPQCSGSVHLTMHKARTDVVVSGRISAALAMACGSCLKPASLLVKVPVSAVYVEGDENAPTDEQDDLDAEDVLHYDGEELDLKPMIREQLILALPMSPRCKDDCKGLCTICGGDKNQKDCGHKVALEDPRFAALKSLKLE